jgi:L-rhamnose mutarotase
MPRYCFLLQVRPDRLREYRARHRHVWPEMLAALRDTGWRNYSLFLRPDGLLAGYVECDDLDAARAAMARTEVNARWQAEMAPLIPRRPKVSRPDQQKADLRFAARDAFGRIGIYRHRTGLDGQRPDEGFLVLEEIFHLEDQIMENQNNG